MSLLVGEAEEDEEEREAHCNLLQDRLGKELQELDKRLEQKEVQLQHKIKQESEQFRSWKATREKEVLQALMHAIENELEVNLRVHEAPTADFPKFLIEVEITWIPRRIWTFQTQNNLSNMIQESDMADEDWVESGRKIVKPNGAKSRKNWRKAKVQLVPSNPIPTSAVETNEVRGLQG
ncbi:hypothetical protein J5N97_005061 [Dioscorea zingiberensis]|uniref:Uncharacterized protein n=1 Tax=Dioscorea zingiberensis TaxID=325984 RepID=A0A9D5D7D6_9LILI|nr:hypothetical protein J5N97_005061 [Dioscorea zingiberensis]